MSEQQGIDTVARETGKLKQELAEIKDEMNEKFDSLDEEDKADLHTVTEFVDHFNNCDKDDCDIHNLKEQESKTWFLKGITKGIQLGKKLKR